MSNMQNKIWQSRWNAMKLPWRTARNLNRIGGIMKHAQEICCGRERVKEPLTGKRRQKFLDIQATKKFNLNSLNAYMTWQQQVVQHIMSGYSQWQKLCGNCYLENFAFLSPSPSNNVEEQWAKLASSNVKQHCIGGEREF